MKSTLLLPFLLACNENSFYQVADDDGMSGAAIEVTPMTLDFGTLSAHDDAVIETFTITSVGSSDLDVTDIQVAGELTGFTVISEQTSFMLPPEASMDIEVAFSPMGAYEQRAEAIVYSNADDSPEVPVELLGEGAVPELQIDPDPMDFGTTYVGCDKDNDLTLRNVGTDVLTIDLIQFESDEIFSMVEDYTLPMQLMPSADFPPEESEVHLSFNFWPDDQMDYSSAVTVRSNEPLGSRSGDIMGEGRFAGEYTDEWEIPVDPESDIMFFVDQSCSMDDDQASLASNFTTFINGLSAYTSDWQVVVVNDDDGCNNTGILRPTTSNYQNLFGQGVRAGGGWYTEAGLIVTSTAVDKTDSGECNSGFMRPDAMLHIIMVSDEPEQSPSAWSTYVNAIQTKKGSVSMTKLSAIAGPYPGGCSSAEAGSGYYEAVNATGGEFLSICSNWSSSMSALAEASINQDTFELSRTPIEDTIEVVVNGTHRGSDWHYESSSNAVIFTGAIPTEGDLVDISYAGVATCD